jgi:hypothetical protein
MDEISGSRALRALGRNDEAGSISRLSSSEGSPAMSVVAAAAAATTT